MIRNDPTKYFQVKNTTSCWVEPNKKCKYIKWQECRQVKH